MMSTTADIITVLPTNEHPLACSAVHVPDHLPHFHWGRCLLLLLHPYGQVLTDHSILLLHIHAQRLPGE